MMITGIILLILVGAINLPYKRSFFPTHTWRAIALQTGLFLLGSLILLAWILHDAAGILIKTDLFLLAVVSLVTLVWFFTPRLATQYGTCPKKLITRYPNRFLLRMSLPIWTMKYTEILFQQAFFVTLLFVLLGELPSSPRLIWFTGIVSGIHLVNFFFRDARITGIFFLLSIPMAMVFGNLLLHGYLLLTVSIHLAFYIVFYGWYWFRRQE